MDSVARKLFPILRDEQKNSVTRQPTPCIQFELNLIQVVKLFDISDNFFHVCFFLRLKKNLRHKQIMRSHCNNDQIQIFLIPFWDGY